MKLFLRMILYVILVLTSDWLIHINNLQGSFTFSLKNQHCLLKHLFCNKDVEENQMDSTMPDVDNFNALQILT